MKATDSPDAAFMRMALRLAARGQGRVEPNPMVGCVIVRNGRIIGQGYHQRYGGPHAEVHALRQAGRAARGATAYVTLEPCCHFGKTPPCTDALRAAGIARVVAALRDPNPLVAGRGLRTLRRAGLAVELGLLAPEAAALNAPFLKLMTRHRPWIILKWAQSLDGKIATRTGDSRWITDEIMRAHAHRIRGRVDALMVGRGTAQRDDPQLTCRHGRWRRRAARIVLDAELRLPGTAQLVRTADRIPTWVFCTPAAPASRARRLQDAGCLVHRVAAARSGAGVNLPAVLDSLGAHQMTNVVVEGGGRLLGAFFDQQLADEIHVYIAPRLIGGAGALGPLHGSGVERIAGSPRLSGAALRPLGFGWLLQARLS